MRVLIGARRENVPNKSCFMLKAIDNNLGLRFAPSKDDVQHVPSWPLTIQTNAHRRQQILDTVTH